MSSGISVPEIRFATSADSVNIAAIYTEVYGGKYPNPLMRNPEALAAYIARPDIVWVIAVLGQRVVGSVIYEIEDSSRLGRVYGGVVVPEYRGAGLMERAMVLGYEALARGAGGSGRVDVVYATTRTSTPAPQIITQHLGYKTLGIFPNVHRTDVYETHCLAAQISPAALGQRFTGFRLHPRIQRLFGIVRQSCGLEPLASATPEDLALDDFSASAPLELIAAEKFVLQRFRQLKEQGVLQSHFFPFHPPNVLITSPCQSVEVFGYLSGADQYCTVVAVKKPREYNLTWLIEACLPLVRPLGVRYIEVLVRADKPKAIERVLRGRFVPCAYFPAFQLREGRRYDFVAFSRTFEILDFRHLKLAGQNVLFLQEYLRNVEEQYLTPHARSLVA